MNPILNVVLIRLKEINPHLEDSSFSSLVVLVWERKLSIFVHLIVIKYNPPGSDGVNKKKRNNREIL